MQTIGIALLGVGTVGSAVARTLQEKGDELARQTGLQLVVRWGMARHPERVIAAGLPEQAATTSLDPILEDPNVVVIVEALGGEEPAATYMKRALQAGKHVVTANKEALSKHFAELVAVAREQQRALLFEASVGAGIPLMASLRQLLSVNRWNGSGVSSMARRISSLPSWPRKVSRITMLCARHNGWGTQSRTRPLMWRGSMPRTSSVSSPRSRLAGTSIPIGSIVAGLRVSRRIRSSTRGPAVVR